MNKDKKVSNIQSWNYSGEADLVLYEQHQSNVAKITLIGVVVTLVSALTLILLNWSYFFDLIANPSVMLVSDNVNLEYGTEFDAKNYIIPDSMADIQNKVFVCEIRGGSAVNPYARTEDWWMTYVAPKYDWYTPVTIDRNTKIIKSYEVHYLSQNEAQTTDKVLVVNIVDTTAPVIALTSESAFLVQGVQTGEYFKALDYVESITDNYTLTENIESSFAEGNWNTPLNPQTGIGTLEVIYTATDEAGNVATATLTVYIFENEELRDQFEQEQAERAVAEGRATPTPTPSPTPTPTPEPTEAPPPETEAPAPTSGGGGGGSSGGDDDYTPENPSPDTVTFKASDITWSLSDGLDGVYTAVAYSVVSYTGTGYCSPQFPNEQAVPGGTWTICWVDSAGVQVGTSHVYFTD